MRLSEQLFYEKNFDRKKAPKRKTNVDLIFCLLNFFLLVGFRLVYIFVRLKSFRKKKINCLEIVLITSYTKLLTCTPINPPIENLFVRAYFYL